MYEYQRIKTFFQKAYIKYSAKSKNSNTHMNEHMWQKTLMVRKLLFTKENWKKLDVFKQQWQGIFVDDLVPTEIQKLKQIFLTQQTLIHHSLQEQVE